MKIIDLHFLGNETTIASFLIESSEGPILVETGPHSTFSHLTKGIENAGYKVEDVQHVFLTHIHLDHAGAAWTFAKNGAKIYLHPFGVGHMADPSKLMESAKRIYQDKMDMLWGRMESIDKNLLIEVEDEAEITIGDKTFKSWHTPGHANHHIAWQLDNIIFTGDVAGVKIENGPVIAPLPPPDIHIEKWQKSIDLLKKLNPEKCYLTHYGEITNIHEHLDELSRNIHTQANWIKEHLGKGESLAEMTPQFDAFCVEDLKKQGLNDAEIAQYQAANPAWMSVAGLARYWKKKAEGKL